MTQLSIVFPSPRPLMNTLLTMPIGWLYIYIYIYIHTYTHTEVKSPWLQLIWYNFFQYQVNVTYISWKKKKSLTSVKFYNITFIIFFSLQRSCLIPQGLALPMIDKILSNGDILSLNTHLDHNFLPFGNWDLNFKTVQIWPKALSYKHVQLTTAFYIPRKRFFKKKKKTSWKMNIKVKF